MNDQEIGVVIGAFLLFHVISLIAIHMWYAGSMRKAVLGEAASADHTQPLRKLVFQIAFIGCALSLLCTLVLIAFDLLVVLVFWIIAVIVVAPIVGIVWWRLMKSATEKFEKKQSSGTS